MFACHPRRRMCLLKGCERKFHPVHPLSRYCSDSCRQAARRWSRRLANQRYRGSQPGKARRRAQCRRYRERVCQRNETTGRVCSGSKGYQGQTVEETNPCHRPGCYVRFAHTPRSPHQKYCSARCRQALRRVLVREQRWRRRMIAFPRTGPLRSRGASRDLR